jgi:hypothetical protein
MRGFGERRFARRMFRRQRLGARPLAEANEWLERYGEFWETRYLRLDAFSTNCTARKRETQDVSGAKGNRSGKISQ